MRWSETLYEPTGGTGRCLGYHSEAVVHRELRTPWEAVHLDREAAETWVRLLAKIPGHLPVVALGDVLEAPETCVLLLEQCEAPVLSQCMPDDPVRFFRMLAEGILAAGEAVPELVPVHLSADHIHVYGGHRPRVGIRAFQVAPDSAAAEGQTRMLYPERTQVLQKLARWMAGRTPEPGARWLKQMAEAPGDEDFRVLLEAAGQLPSEEAWMSPSLIAVSGAPALAVQLARVAAAAKQGEVFLIDGDLLAPAIDLLQPGDREGRVFRIEGEEDVPGVPVLLALAARGRLDRQSVSGAGHEVRQHPGLRVFHGSMDPGQYEYYPETQWQELLEVMRRMATLVVVSVPANPYDAFALSAMLQADRVVWAGGGPMTDTRRNNRIISLLQKTQNLPVSRHLMVMMPDAGMAAPDRGTLRGVCLPEAAAWIENHPRYRTAQAWGETLPALNRRNQHALRTLLTACGVLKQSDKKWFRGGKHNARG